MKKLNLRKKRTLVLKMDARNYYEFQGVLFDLNTQKIHGVRNGDIHPLIGTVKLEYQRARDNGIPKVLHQSTSPTNDSFIDSNHQLFSYDHLIAIDTNTHFLNGSKVSITAAFHLKPESRESNKIGCSAAVLAVLELWNVVESPENVGWWQILQSLQGRPDFFGKIGLVVDSDLGNHDLFNSREKPICNNYFLPENVTLIYASDKGGPEHLSSTLIKYCHDLASDFYVPHKLIMCSQGLFPGIPNMCSHFRQWPIDIDDIRQFVKAIG